MMPKQDRPNGFKPPPHANAGVHKKIMAKLEEMSEEELFQTAVESGVYTKKGNLAKHYAGGHQ
jgi:hypothetical protein